jgi:hypothetical protein
MIILEKSESLSVVIHRIATAYALYYKAQRGQAPLRPFVTFLVENLVVWIKMLTFVPLISNLILYGTTTKRNQFHRNLSCNAKRH